jgi:eukaryotic-like serine/threonine-protein kinase
MRDVNRTTVDGRYVLSRPVGGGAMAEVFLAHDGVLDRDVALKILRNQYANDGEFVERFRREARSAASLSHPNIVPVYDRGDTEDGSSYIAMEYVPGGTLKERLDERGPIEPDRALAATAQVAEALGAAHAKGVIHRDIKPQNILLTETGHLKVADFGIARAASAATISATNAVFGTAGYLSPEQALGEPATPKSDLYSLGVVLYEMLTGAVPYRADNPVAVCMKHVTEPLRPPRKLDPTIPSAVDALVVKMLAKDPADRPASASELLDDIERVRAGQAPPLPTPRGPTPRLGVPAKPAPARAAAGSNRTPPPPQAQPPGRRDRRRKAVWGILACVLFGIVLLGSALGPSHGPGEEVTVNRAQDVARGGLASPTAGTGGDGGAGTGDAPQPVPDPPPSTPPASAPPASPDDGPGQSQYAGGG